MGTMETLRAMGLRVKDLVLWSRLLGLLFLLASPVSPRATNQDSCDTTVWNIAEAAVGVHDVTGSCSEGHIDWRSPYGAIRVTLHLNTSPIRGLKIPFEACFTASTLYTTVKIFLEDSKSKLKPIELLDSSHPVLAKEMCFVSLDGDPVVLYMESELESQSAALGLVQIDYDNRRLPVWREGDEQPDDCRPCTESELVEAVCSSDFVLTGGMSHVSHNDDWEETSIHVKVNKIHRQRLSLFNDPSSGSASNHMAQSRTYPRLKFHTENGVREWPRNNEVIASFPSLDSSQSNGVILAPIKCGIRAGQGEFLFVGRIRLKRALLQCAPRVEDFKDIWRRAEQNARNLCLLD